MVFAANSFEMSMEMCMGSMCMMCRAHNGSISCRTAF